ncbi:PREDICTED: venom carboxylesterase-6-like [Nicrophorus vespilloides]|uniref:Carboxylic ester hydrolase n=1 Tax=Nicrophorus vespilloides TaxID=110193 RepID=A0ABM1MQX5_NICVS|nr:PREDICTED: venom carboxylesterase-6-like [Nicrophorus vespilloides]
MLLIINVLFVLYSCLAKDLPRVTLKDGSVEGYYKSTLSGTEYSAFEGIPYAYKPIGKYRFEEPKPIKPWKGTWQAKTLSTCMQYYQYTKPGDDFVIGDEDCLHVNVYTKSTNPKHLKNVIVFIHGGAFMFNSGGSYGERFLMDYDVIYVTFNYRLGPLGFLSTEDRVVPGNNGLKDQQLALKWIKENIQRFGGNPDSVTLAGMSAGGSSVHYHTMAPIKNDVQLFHKAIIQSGTALNPWSQTENSREKALKMGAILGCPTHDTYEMLKCMKLRPGKQIVAAVKQFQPWLYNPFTPFGVVVDKWSENPIVPQHPYKTLKEKNVMSVPTIFSNVQSEGLYPSAEFYGDNHFDEIDARWNEIIPHLLEYNYTLNPTEKLDVSSKIKQFYFGNEKPSRDNFNKFIEMISDRIFLVDIEKSVRLHAAANEESTYYYYYGYQALHSKVEPRLKTRNIFGPAHGDDTILILSTNIDTTSNKEDKEMSTILQDMWVEFCATKKPKVLDVNWESVSKDVSKPIKFLRINSKDDIHMEQKEYLGNRINFWNTLPFKENEKLLNMKDEL